MPETPHIKRFEEWLEVYDEDPKPEHFVAAAMLNDLVVQRGEKKEIRLTKGWLAPNSPKLE